jgi:hypothetical protein
MYVGSVRGVAPAGGYGYNELVGTAYQPHDLL